ncbi:tetraspanin-7-like [Tachysurus fulvidraco]|uniref:tetraspanin-7-like n=1 Tax=Tachysurus fulvidraco TaxID=1234273 RepID=UPI000F4E87E2|nr:tetraspanin-7-like [Tachysurus fulvidraco]
MRERNRAADKAAARTMSCTLVTASYDSLPAQLSPHRVRDQHFNRRLSSPHGLGTFTLSAVPRRPSGLPGYTLSSPHEPNNLLNHLHHHPHQRLSQSLGSKASLAPPVPQADPAPPCCQAVGIVPLLRLALIIFSCLFWAAGLAIFTLGVWAKVSLADYMLLSSNNYPNAPIILLFTGAAISAWGFLGCLSVAANLPCFLRTFGFFQLAVLMGGLAAGLSGLFYREDIAGGFRSGLQRAVEGYGEDEGRSDALDSLQRALKCCGADGWHDWLLSDWAVQDAVSLTRISDNDTNHVSVPDSCCIRRKGCHNRPLPESGTGSTERAGIHTHGCFKKVFSFVNDNVFHIAAAVLALAFTQVAGIILACLLANRLSSQPHRRGR